MDNIKIFEGDLPPEIDLSNENYSHWYDLQLLEYDIIYLSLSDLKIINDLLTRTYNCIT